MPLNIAHRAIVLYIKRMESSSDLSMKYSTEPSNKPTPYREQFGYYLDEAMRKAGEEDTPFVYPVTARHSDQDPNDVMKDNFQTTLMIGGSQRDVWSVQTTVILQSLQCRSQEHDFTAVLNIEVAVE